MSKFKIKLKLQGLELEVEGSREDVPLITQNLAEQFAGLMKPSAAILEGELLTGDASSGGINVAPPTPKKKPRRRPASNGEKTTAESIYQALSWRHDPSKYGNPKQEWSVRDKYLWILFVIEAEGFNEGIPARTLALTFNKQFREAGQLRPNNALRDLGVIKKKTPAAVGEDVTGTPSKWFLTEAGKREAVKLISAALGKPAV